MFGGSYGSFTVVFMHRPVARPASARGAAGGPTCRKHGAAAARSPGACCSDERVGVTPIRSKPTDTAAAGGRQAPLIFLSPLQPSYTSKSSGRWFRKKKNCIRYPEVWQLAKNVAESGNMDDGDYQDGMVYNISQRKNRDYMPG